MQEPLPQATHSVEAFNRNNSAANGATIPVLLCVPQFSERHPAFSEASLRHLIFCARSRQSSHGEVPGNGLDMAIRRVGRKVLIDEGKFFAWLELQNARG